MAYWCIFPTKPSGTINIPQGAEGFPSRNDPKYSAQTGKRFDWNTYREDWVAAVKKLAKEICGEEPLEIHSLPYPKAPNLNPGMPTFCFGGKECWDRSACPRSISCCD